jgi:hypothetical protein
MREEKHTVGSIKNIFRNDEKYVHAGGTNILVKHAS